MSSLYDIKITDDSGIFATYSVPLGQSIDDAIDSSASILRDWFESHGQLVYSEHDSEQAIAELESLSHNADVDLSDRFAFDGIDPYVYIGEVYGFRFKLFRVTEYA